jgi:hypothetical protein
VSEKLPLTDVPREHGIEGETDFLRSIATTAEISLAAVQMLQKLIVALYDFRRAALSEYCGVDCASRHGG